VDLDPTVHGILLLLAIDANLAVTGDLDTTPGEWALCTRKCAVRFGSNRGY
jgi:hypothetical protein